MAPDKVKEILAYYSNHNVRSTQKEFGITYTELKKICDENNFKKSSEQIKETYKTTRIEKYGSIQGYRLAKRGALESNYFRNWMNKLNEKENEND